MVYRLLLTRGEDGPRRSGVVFCADDERARISALALLCADPAHRSVQVFEGEREVARIDRQDAGD